MHPPDVRFHCPTETAVMPPLYPIQKDRQNQWGITPNATLPGRLRLFQVATKNPIVNSRFCDFFLRIP